MVEPFHGDAAPRVALGLVLQRRRELGRGVVAIRLVQDLEHVPVGVGEPVRRPVAVVAVAPPLPPTSRLDSPGHPVERLLVPGPERQVADAGPSRLGQLEAVAPVVSPSAQVRRRPVLRLDLHAEDVDEEPEALLRRRREKLGVVDVREIGRSRHQRSTSALRPSRSYDNAPDSRAARFSRSFSARVREAASTSSMRTRGTTATPSESRTTPSPGSIVLPRDVDGLVDRAGPGLRGAADPDPTGPDREPDARQVLDVSHSGVDEQRSGAAVGRLGREQLPDQRDRRGLRHRQHEDVAGLDALHRRVHHQVVVLTAANRSRRAGDTRTGNHLHEGGVDETPAPRCLVDGRRPETRELVPGAHSPVTTSGITRLNASA